MNNVKHVKFRMNDVKRVNISLVFHFKLSLGLCPGSKEENDYISLLSYVNVVGSLIYSILCTR